MSVPSVGSSSPWSSIWSCILQKPQIKLDVFSDCALVYNPLISMKHPKLMLNIPSLHESGCDHFPHFVMMAVLANMILDKDPDFEAMISRKVSQFIAAFGKEKEASEGGGRQWPKSHSTEEQSKAYRRDN